MADQDEEFKGESSAQIIELRPGRGLRVYHKLASKKRDNSAPTVFFIHGFGGRLAQYRFQIPFLQDKGYNVVAVDLLGHGKAQKPLDWDLYKGTEFVGDLIALYQKYHTKRNFFVGHSYGSGLLQLMLSHLVDTDLASTIEKVVLIGSRYAPLGKGLWYTPTFMLNWLRPLMGPAFEKLAYHANTDKALKAKEAAIGTTNPTDILKAVGRQFTWTTDEDIKKLKFPVLQISGAADNITTPAEASKLKDVLPNSQLVVLDDSAHLPMLEQPDTVNDLILKFFTNPQ